MVNLAVARLYLLLGVAEFFNIQDDVSSPTFTIVNEYITKDLNIYHFDVYKIKSSYEFESTIGLDYFDTGLCIIEWGDIIQDILPKDTIFIDIQKLDTQDKRNLILRRNNDG